VQSRVYSPYTALGFRREGRVLVRDRAQQRIVAKARAMYGDCGSFSRVAAWLNSQGLLSAADRPWRGQTVKRMFRMNDVIGCPLDQIPPDVPVTRNTWMVPFGYRMEAGEFVALGGWELLREVRFSRRSSCAIRSPCLATVSESS